MRITVFGSARVSESSTEYEEAHRLGDLLAERGDTIICGGYDGAMAAVSRGARERGGHVVGVTVAPWATRLSPNPYLSDEIAAETLYERLESLIGGDALIALPGGAGTLGEVALAWNLRQMDLIAPKPIVLVGDVWRRMLDAFRRHLIVDDRDLGLLTWVGTVEEAIAAIDAAVESRGRWLG